MTSGTLLTGTQAVTITADRQGPGIILGTIIRSHPFQPGTAYAFEGPNNTIRFAGLTSLTSITVRVTSALVLDFPFGGAMNREYEIALAGAASSLATLRLHYEDAERNGNDESRSQLWHYQNPWGIAGKTGDSDTQNWIELSGLTELAGRSLLATFPRASPFPP